MNNAIRKFIAVLTSLLMLINGLPLTAFTALAASPVINSGEITTYLAPTDEGYTVYVPYTSPNTAVTTDSFGVDDTKSKHQRRLAFDRIGEPDGHKQRHVLGHRQSGGVRPALITGLPATVRPPRATSRWLCTSSTPPRSIPTTRPAATPRIR